MTSVGRIKTLNKKGKKKDRPKLSDDFFRFHKRLGKLASNEEFDYCKHGQEELGLHLSYCARACYLMLREIEIGHAEAIQRALGVWTHDHGKIHEEISHLFRKDYGRWTEEDRERGKMHVEKGVEMIKRTGLDKLLGEKVLQFSLEAIMFHHTHFKNGGKSIPLQGRVMAIPDSFHAMVTKRGYNSVKSREEAIEALRSKSGTQFDPELVEAFLRVEPLIPVISISELRGRVRRKKASGSAQALPGPSSRIIIRPLMTQIKKETVSVC